MSVTVCVIVKGIPLRAWICPEVEVPRFQENRHMKAVRLSALFTSCLYPQRNIAALTQNSHWHSWQLDKFVCAKFINSI